jgi:hypothetical protein
VHGGSVLEGGWLPVALSGVFLGNMDIIEWNGQCFRPPRPYIPRDVF